MCFVVLFTPPEKEDQLIKQWSANPELIAAIARIQPKSSPEGVVPSSLPDHLKAKLPNVTSEELKGLYNIQKGVSMVNEGSLLPQDLVALHIRSYRKILEIENPQESPIRLRRVFSSIFHDVLNELRGHQRLSPVRSDCVRICILIQKLHGYDSCIKFI